MDKQISAKGTRTKATGSDRDVREPRPAEQRMQIYGPEHSAEWRPGQLGWPALKTVLEIQNFPV